MKGLSAMEKKLIEAKAKEVLEKYHNGTESVDVVAICKKAGFELLTAIMPEIDDGFIIVNPNRINMFGVEGYKFIGVNANRNVEEKRFIIAHELGHYFMDCNGADTMVYALREKKVGKPEAEQDVDYFAACLLMPETAFKDKYSQLKSLGNTAEDIVAVLKNTFEVEQISVERRIKELALEN